MAKHAIPKSKAKTAYGLLSEIRKLIITEPRRYDQSEFLTQGEDAKRWYEDLAPKCGTVGCVAGWTEVLKPGPSAEETLGLSAWQTGQLFLGTLAGPRKLTLAGVRQHARRGERMIAKFQKTYAKQLKAKKV